MTTSGNPKRADSQISGLAGELFVAAELLKRGLQTSVTFGNAKAVDLLAYNENTGRTFTVQVKAVRTRNYFLIGHSKVNPTHLYVFVVLNKPGQPVQYYVVPGEHMASHPDRFAKWFTDPKMPGIHPKTFEELGYADAWDVFDAPT